MNNASSIIRRLYSRWIILSLFLLGCAEEGGHSTRKSQSMDPAQEMPTTNERPRQSSSDETPMFDHVWPQMNNQETQENTEENNPQFGLTNIQIGQFCLMNPLKNPCAPPYICAWHASKFGAASRCTIPCNFKSDCPSGFYCGPGSNAGPRSVCRKI